MGEITRSIIDYALDSSLWDLGNEVLYSLCRKHPGHEKADEIIAKVWLIGRSYAAAIERGRTGGDKFSSDEFYEKVVAGKIAKSKFKIDEELKKVKNISDGVCVHKQLIKVFKKINKKRKLRSLASKYLHFHKPNIFYIYDSRAAKTIKAIYKDITNKHSVKLISVNCKQSKPDDEYLKFCSYCEWLQSYIKDKFKLTKKLTPRQLDKVLLKIESVKEKKKKRV